MRWLLLVTLAVFLCSGAALLALRSGMRGTGDTSADPLTPDARVSSLSVPDFTLVDQDGRTVNQDIFKGRVTVVDFFFTHCPFVCPVLTTVMKDVQRELQDTPVRLLSISVDPDHDTPEVLRAYAKDHGADESRWTFLTGERTTVSNIVQNGLQFALGEDPSRPIKLEDGTSMNNVVHPSWFALIGPDRRVLGVYLATVPEDVEALVKRARAAASNLK